MTPRIIGQPIHLCFSEGRSSGSLRVAISPEGLRQAIAQACGDRIITPSSTACPPTRVSSPLSSAGRSWTATRKRTKFRKERTVFDAPEGSKAPLTRLTQESKISRASLWRKYFLEQGLETYLENAASSSMLGGALDL